uniref:PH domain-containing protein n=1 Tax=Trichuris muris TaxID=70415 RepID=A0A5S6QQH3_TRIMR
MTYQTGKSALPGRLFCNSSGSCLSGKLSNEGLALDEHYRIRSHLPQLFSYSRFQRHVELDKEYRRAGIQTSNDSQDELLDGSSKLQPVKGTRKGSARSEARKTCATDFESSNAFISKIEFPIAKLPIGKWASAQNFTDIDDGAAMAMGYSFKCAGKAPCREFGENRGTRSEDVEGEEEITKNYSLMPAVSVNYLNSFNLANELSRREPLLLSINEKGNQVCARRASLDLRQVNGFFATECMATDLQDRTETFGTNFSKRSRPLSNFASDFTHTSPRSVVVGTEEAVRGLALSDCGMYHLDEDCSKLLEVSEETAEAQGNKPSEKRNVDADMTNDDCVSNVRLPKVLLGLPSNFNSRNACAPAKTGTFRDNCCSPILNDAVYARVEMETKLMRLNALKEMRYRDMMRSYQSLSARVHEFRTLRLSGLEENIAARAMALIASERYNCVNEEIRRLYALLRSPVDTVSKKSLGTINVSNIVVPISSLKNLSKTAKACTKYAFICVMKYQETVAWSEVIYYEQKVFNKRLEFQSKLSIANLSYDHKVQFSLYAMSVKEAYSNSRVSMKERILKMLTVKPTQKDNTFPWNTDLQLAAVCYISLACANKWQFTFDMVNLPSIIHSDFFAFIRYSCSDLNAYETSGHLDFLQQNNGIDKWRGYWCELKDGDILLWQRQEDAKTDPVKVFQLKYCASNRVLCANCFFPSEVNSMLLDFRSDTSSNSRVIFRSKTDDEKKLWQQGIDHVLMCLELWRMKHEVTKL